MAQDPAPTEVAIKQLYSDAIDIYERARKEVTIDRRDGRRQKYAPVRYKQQIDRGYDDGVLSPAVAGIIRKRTTGFDHHEEARREDVMLETLVVDTSKPYRRLFTPKTVDVARTPRRAAQKIGASPRGATCPQLPKPSTLSSSSAARYRSWSAASRSTSSVATTHLASVKVRREMISGRRTVPRMKRSRSPSYSQIAAMASTSAPSARG
jgi:hypothetical protein